ncbi:MAG TPA: hypothetical protein VN088_19000 [Nocardioides sp.]|nr:hypothetical protein [Nocardioides sp.]
MRRRDERGAVAVLVGLMMVVVLGAAAFTVDLGQQRVGRADMQSLADVVAMDLARELNGRSYATLSPLMAGLAAKSEARNQSVIGYAAHLPVLTVTLGTWSSAGTPQFTAITSGVPTAVKVQAQTTVGFAFGGITGTHSGNASRTAYGTASNRSCVKIGSYAVRITSSNSPILNAVINKALGGSLNLDALSYQGLASANVSLLGLATQLGLGTVDELLTTSVSLKSLYLASAQVLQNNGNTAAASILNTIAASIMVTQSVKLGSLVSATPGDGAAETASVDALGLVQGTAEIANGSSAVDIPGLSASLGLVSATGKLTLIQGAQVGCGEAGSDAAKASTAQASLSVAATVPSSTAGLTGLSVSGSTTVTLNAASAQAALTGVTCGAGTSADPSGDTISATSSLVGASVGQTLSISGGITDSGALGSLLNGVLGLLGGVVKVTVSGTVQIAASTTDPATTKTASPLFPPNTAPWSSAIDTGSGDLGLDTTHTTVTWTTPLTIHAYTGILGLSLTETNLSLAQTTTITSNLVSSLTNNVLGPVLTKANTTLLQPIEGMLGLSLAGADVFGGSPTCGMPKLVG